MAVDFFHASEHLHAAIATVYGDGTHETQFRHARLRDTLRDEDGGVDKIIRALKHLASKHPRKTSLATEPAYFRKHRKRMRYVELQSTSRRRARRWSRSASSRAERGGASAARKPFSLPSGWDQSDRFDEA